MIQSGEKHGYEVEASILQTLFGLFLTLVSDTLIITTLIFFDHSKKSS